MSIIYNRVKVKIKTRYSVLIYKNGSLRHESYYESLSEALKNSIRIVKESFKDEKDIEIEYGNFD